MSVLRADRAFVCVAVLAALSCGKAAWAQGANDPFPSYWDRSFPLELQDPEKPYQLPEAEPSARAPQLPTVQFGSPGQQPEQAGQVNRPVLLGPGPGIPGQQAPVVPLRPPAAAGAPVQLWPPAAVEPQRNAPALQFGTPAMPLQQQLQPRPSAALPVPGPQRSGTTRASRDAVGVLDTETNRALGPDIWAGTSRQAATRAVQQLPDSANSPIMRSLAIRALLTKARAPDGMDPVAWTKLRFAKLFQMGELLEAVELAHAASDQFQDEELSRNGIEALLLAGVEEGACLDVRAKAPQFDTVFWQQALVYCRMMGGQPRAAQALAGSLRDRGVEDPVFFALFDAMNGAKVNLGEARDLSPLHLAMAHAAKVQLPADAVSVQDPTRLAAIARQPNTPPEVRLRAAERAGQLGTLSPEGLAAVYRGLPAGLGGNASLYRSIRSERAMGKRAELLARWLNQARWPVDPATRLRLDMLRPLDPTPLTVPLAPSAAKALYAAGDAEMAKPWYDAVEQSGNPEAQRQITLLWPLAVMYEKQMLNDGQMRRWLDAMSRMPNGQARAARVLATLEALGYEVRGGGATNAVEAGGGADPAVLQQLAAAAAARRVGETTLLSLIALGREGVAGADQAVVATVIRSLRRAGLEIEARAAAREAIVAAIS